MSRHLSVDGKMVGPNRGSSKDVLYEFYNNWLSLKDLDHVCMVFFENLIKNDRLVIQEILDFYGIRLKEKNLAFTEKKIYRCRINAECRFKNNTYVIRSSYI